MARKKPAADSNEPNLSSITSPPSPAIVDSVNSSAYRSFHTAPALNPALLEAVKNNSIVGKLHEIRQSAQIRLLSSVDDAAYNLIMLMKSPDDRIALDASKEILKLNRMYDPSEDGERSKSPSLTQEQLTAAVTGLISALGIAAGDSEIRETADASLTSKLKSKLASSFSSPDDSLAIADKLNPDFIMKESGLSSTEGTDMPSEKESDRLPLNSSLPVSEGFEEKVKNLNLGNPLYTHSIPDVDDDKIPAIAESVITQEQGLFRRQGTIAAETKKARKRNQS